jgi:hypothetical protein
LDSAAASHGGQDFDALKIISDVLARKMMAIEHRRRADWRKRELAAGSFQAECDHASAAQLPCPAPDRMQ